MLLFLGDGVKMNKVVKSVDISNNNNSGSFYSSEHSKSKDSHSNSGEYVVLCVLVCACGCHVRWLTNGKRIQRDESYPHGDYDIACKFFSAFFLLLQSLI